MWTIAVVLLGLAVVFAVAGFHIGPHAHALAGVFGLVASIWLVLMAIDGHSTPLLWSVLGGDLVVAGGLGTLAWKGISTSGKQTLHRDSHVLQGSSGTAVTELKPDGVVRVNGETWSATSRNGNFPEGTQVQVILASGVRLEVWGEVDSSLDPDVFAQADLTLGGDASIQRKEGS
jgi:membrane-bound ClpP family serine protease